MCARYLHSYRLPIRSLEPNRMRDKVISVVFFIDIEKMRHSLVIFPEETGELTQYSNKILAVH